jgi:Tol biopolymer transport system component
MTKRTIVLLATIVLMGVTGAGAQAAVPATEMGAVIPTAVSANGRFLAFISSASNLVPGDTNGVSDVFVYDRVADSFERVSVSSAGDQGNAESGIDALTMSADGRFVVFSSDATNLVANDTNDYADKFIHDRATGATRRLGAIQFYSSTAISADGRYLAFDAGGAHVGAIARLDRSTGRIIGVAIGSDETPTVIGISADGDRVAADGSGGIYVHDFTTGRTHRVRLSNLVSTINLDAVPNALSADGRYLMFTSSLSNIVAGDTNGKSDVFVRDLLNHRTNRISISNGERQSDAGSSGLGISGKGRYRLFVSFGHNLVAGDTNGVADIFVRDSVAGTTVRCSVATDGTQADRGSSDGILSQNGVWTFFDSAATNLVPGDTNGAIDPFVRGPGC